MELRVLEYFLALAREGSVSAAAEALHISQPTLSRQLMDLERELGCTLFERGRRGITLTEDGMLLRRRASEIVGLAQITRNELLANRGVCEGEVRIGCAETRAMDLLAAVMRDFRAEHPAVTFVVSSDLAEATAEKLERGLVDFGLVMRVNDAWGMRSVALPSHERACVIMPEDHPLAAHGSVGFDDLADVPLLVPSSYRESGILGGELPRADGGRLDVVGEFGLPYNGSRMVRAGMGCMITLEGLIETPPGSGLATRPLEGSVELGAFVAWKPFCQRTRACEAFLERLQERFG